MPPQGRPVTYGSQHGMMAPIPQVSTQVSGPSSRNRMRIASTPAPDYFRGK